VTRDPLAQPVPRVSAHPAALADDALLVQCELGRGRSGGPAGQHRNRVATLVVLTHTASGVAARAGERRSPEANKAVALRRLRYALAVEHRADVPAGEARTELWMRRCTRDGRIVCAERHRDHPALLAEALDTIAASSWDIDRAAARLCCTKSQLVKLVGSHAPALALVNANLKARGKRTLSP
jgi:hypothetical protein